MDYKKHYQRLVDRAQNRVLDSYHEQHHIVPRCLGGSDDASNLVNLTPEEHYLAHQLLVKIYPDNRKLVNAAMMMIPKRPSNKLYGWLRRRFSNIQSIRQSGINNTQFGTRWIHNESTMTNKKISASDPTPVGWKNGRRMVFERECKLCGNLFRRVGLERYCSTDCKRHDRSESHKIIDNNLEDIIKYFIDCRSITKTLKAFGVKGERAGNAYLSGILKARGFDVKKRGIRKPT